MAPNTLTLLFALVLAASADGSYGRGYSYLGSPRGGVIIKAAHAKRPIYSRQSAVFRSPYDSYDEADALRTADHDVHLRRTAVLKAVRRPVYTPPYQPVIVKKTVHAPLHTVHEEHPVSSAVPHVVHEHVPYQYDHHVVPECARTDQPDYNITVCLDDAAYPTDTIIHELKKNPPLTEKLMSDVTYQSADNLVDGLTKEEEEHYTREHYLGASSTEYQNEGGYICPSDIFYGRVKRAVNTFGEWKVIVNLPDNFKHDPKYKKYVQTSRLESCVHPGAACNFVNHLVPSACLQKYAFVRLVAYDHARGLHVDSFKLPSACSCHLAAKPKVY